MVTPAKITVALDGHDGAGKTTLARQLAKAIGGVYVRPFAGELGEKLLSLGERGAFDVAARIACEALERAVAGHEGPVLVFDRHWMTVFTLLPESHWEPFLPAPPTMLCWADLETTLDRLGRRREDVPDRGYHRLYLERYTEIATRFDCNMLRTDRESVAESLARLIQWFKRLHGDDYSKARVL